MDLLRFREIRYNVYLHRMLTGFRHTDWLNEEILLLFSFSFCISSFEIWLQCVQCTYSPSLQQISVNDIHDMQLEYKLVKPDSKNLQIFEHMEIHHFNNKTNKIWILRRDLSLHRLFSHMQIFNIVNYVSISLPPRGPNSHTLHYPYTIICLFANAIFFL